MLNKNIKDYIYVVKDALSLNLCDEILGEFKSSDEWQDTHIAKGFDKNIRNCQTIGISFSICSILF